MVHTSKRANTDQFLMKHKVDNIHQMLASARTKTKYLQTHSSGVVGTRNGQAYIYI